MPFKETIAKIDSFMSEHKYTILAATFFCGAVAARIKAQSSYEIGYGEGIKEALTSLINK